jgi:hypothetical protein
MQNEPESRLRDLFARLPTASRAVEDRALAAALAALPAAGARHRRPVRTALLVAAAAVCLLALAAGALGAAGALHVSLGGVAPEAAPAARGSTASRLIVPQGARGIAAVVDGRLWFTSRSGLRIEGLPVESAALSPHALYVAAGIGDSLVVMAPDGTRAWSHPAGGRVVGIAWAPSGLRIAYVVRTRRGDAQLRTIEGDGDHDRVLDRAVRSVTPSWRADALAVAYVGAGGRPVVYDLARRAHHVVGEDRTANATRVAFAPQGRSLAVGSTGRLWISGLGRVSTGAGSVAGIAWTGGDVVVALEEPDGSSAVHVVRVGQTGPAGKPLVVSGRITALDAGGGDLVLAVRGSGVGTRVVAPAGHDRATPEVLLDVPAGSTVGTLAVR